LFLGLLHRSIEHLSISTPNLYVQAANRQVLFFPVKVGGMESKAGDSLMNGMKMECVDPGASFRYFAHKNKLLTFAAGLITLFFRNVVYKVCYE
jgi:hypothetical protein